MFISGSGSDSGDNSSRLYLRTDVSAFVLLTAPADCSEDGFLGEFSLPKRLPKIQKMERSCETADVTLCNPGMGGKGADVVRERGERGRRREREGGERQT